MALSLGRNNPMPMRLGGGISYVEVEFNALMQALEPAFDPSDEQVNTAEVYAEASAIAQVWIVSQRLGNQGQPLKMIDALPDWEAATLLRPVSADLETVRRARLAAKLRGLVSNTLEDIYDACAAMLGAAFVSLAVRTNAQQIVYWPGGPTAADGSAVTICTAPGPPSREWSTNRCMLTVVTAKNGVTNAVFYDLMDRLVLMLDAMAPAWMSFQWTTGSGFLVGSSGVGEVGL